MCKMYVLCILICLLPPTSFPVSLHFPSLLHPSILPSILLPLPRHLSVGITLSPSSPPSPCHSIPQTTQSTDLQRLIGWLLDHSNLEVPEVDRSALPFAPPPPAPEPPKPPPEDPTPAEVEEELSDTSSSCSSDYSDDLEDDESGAVKNLIPSGPVSVSRRTMHHHGNVYHPLLVDGCTITMGMCAIIFSVDGCTITMGMCTIHFSVDGCTITMGMCAIIFSVDGCTITMGMCTIHFSVDGCTITMGMCAITL